MPRAKQGNVRINVLIQPKVLNAMKALAKRKGSTYSEEIRQACLTYVREEIAALRASQEAHAPETDQNGASDDAQAA